jgi:hypothetical protein
MFGLTKASAAHHMSLFRTRTASGPDRREALAAAPRLSPGVVVERLESGQIVLRRQVPRGSGWLERLRPPVSERRFELDAFGTFVIECVERRERVIDTICVFEQKFGLSHREAELGVVAFLKQLMQRGLVVVASPE